MRQKEPEKSLQTLGELQIPGNIGPNPGNTAHETERTERFVNCYFTTKVGSLEWLQLFSFIFADLKNSR